MADNSKKLSELPEVANTTGTDRVLILRDPAGSPSTRTITVANLALTMSFSNSVPANSSSNGVAGTIRYDSSYVYVCVANNTWKRSALSTW
jgi:hypothetical protein